MSTYPSTLLPISNTSVSYTLSALSGCDGSVYPGRKHGPHTRRAVEARELYKKTGREKRVAAHLSRAGGPTSRPKRFLHIKPVGVDGFALVLQPPRHGRIL